MVTPAPPALRVVPAPPATTPLSTSYEIRALTTADELVESYRLRYEVYGAMGYLQRPSESRLEIDAYDPWSVPFGAFDAASGTMIGTLRLITTETQLDYEHLVRDILAELCDAEMAEQVLGPRPHPLPAITTDQIARQIEAFNTRCFAIHELSRFIVHPDHRGSGVSRGLVTLGTAYAMRPAPAILIAGCLPEHVPMYARYGFSQLPNTSLDYYDGVGQIANTIICRTDVMLQSMQSQVDDLVRSMASGASEHALELGRGSRVLFRFAAPRRVRRRTIEW